MLRELHMSGLGVIDDLDLELAEGLNVLTGETGAGKTMVTIGLSLDTLWSEINHADPAKRLVS